ncbi:YcsE-related riboflavin metabolism phosphatase [Mycoplasmopsis gallinarum]
MKLSKNELKSNIKMAAFDVDGTIMAFGHPEFTVKMKETFSDLAKNDIYSIIASAREFVTIGNFLEQLPTLDYFIGANGMFIYDYKNKKMLYEKPMKYDEMMLIYQNILNDPNCEGFNIVDLNNVYYSDGMNIDTWFLKPHQAKLKPMSQIEEIDKEHIHIITLSSYDEQTTEALAQKVEKIIAEHNLDLEVNSRWHKGLFVAPKGISKFNALEILAQKLNLSASKNLIAFGDSGNDYEMIENSAYGVRVGNHDEHLKTIADDAAMNPIDDGVYYKLKELNLI